MPPPPSHAEQANGDDHTCWNENGGTEQSDGHPAAECGEPVHPLRDVEVAALGDSPEPIEEGE